MKEKNGSEEIFILPSSTAALRDVAIIQVVATDNTDSAFIPKLKLSAYYNASGTTTEREGFAVEGGASATKIGFFGATCVVKPVLSTVAALGVSLAALGLFSGTLASDYTIIQDNGTPLTQRPYLNFIAGSNITLTIADNSGSTRTDVTIAASSSGGSYPPATCQGRLTLTTAVPVTTSDVTAATTLYFTPYIGNLIGTYSGSAWSTGTFTEKSISLSGLTANLPYDVFIVDSTYALELVAWSTATARATALTLQDGIEVKTGALTRRYLGTILITSTTGQCSDSLLFRGVWNRYNQLERELLVTDATDTWNYATATWRSWNNSTSNRVNFVIGISENIMHFDAYGASNQGTGHKGYMGIGLDSTSANSGRVTTQAYLSTSGQNTNSFIGALYKGYPGIGAHYLQLLEYAGIGTVTFIGDDGGTGLMLSGGSGWLLG